MSRLDLRAEARAHMPALPSLARATEATRRVAIATWHGRMVNESRSSGVFAALAAQLGDTFGRADLVDACAAFSEEERRHGVLCGAVVEALGGEAIADVEPAEPLPLHADVPRTEAVIRNLLSVSCLSETVAVALIGAEREAMTAPTGTEEGGPEGELRALLTRIWADEIGHSRFGWRLVESLLPTIDRAGRARLGAYLRVALRALETHELAHLPITDAAEDVALGVCDGRDARALFHATVTSVIVPRLELMGLPARLAWATRRDDRPLAHAF